jgi:AraC-like DNA-binding protein
MSSTNTIFSEFWPSTALLPYVQSFWLGNFNIQGQDKYTPSVLPNGCVEMIIHLTGDRCALCREEDSWEETAPLILVGLFGQPYQVQFSRNVRVFGIRFYPDGIRNIFGVPPSEFFSTYEDGVDILGMRLKEFCSRIQEVSKVGDQVEMTNEFLETELTRNIKTHDYTHQAMHMIRKNQGLAGYEELTREIPISVRQLQREFKSLYGITVRDYMRLSRLNAVHHYMLAKNQNFTQLSYDLNFSDQSHFIREFKNYTGVAPRTFVKSRDLFIVNPVIRKD